MNCNNRAPDNAKVGDKCKFCGVTWYSKQDEDSEVKITGRALRGIGKLIAAAVVVVLAAISGIVKFFRG